MPEPKIHLLIPNLKKRFSGITSTVLQVLPEMEKDAEIRVLGKSLPGTSYPTWSLFQVFRETGRKGPTWIFHARRNNEMILGLILKQLFRRKLKLVFTSVAQRHHTWLTRFLYKRMDLLLSTSDRSASFLEITPRAIIPHGTDIERYRPVEDLEAAWAETGLPGRFGLGIFGRVRPQKGHREWVEALCQVLPNHPEYTVVIIGETTPKYLPFQEELQKKISDRGLENQFCWLGQRPFSELPYWFRRMSLVAAVPHNEGFGLTCLEAMASGVPVLATRTGGFEMVIRPETDGFLVPCQDAGAIENVLEKALPDPWRLRQMGQAARERMEKFFTARREAESLLAQYRWLVSPFSESTKD